MKSKKRSERFLSVDLSRIIAIFTIVWIIHSSEYFSHGELPVEISFIINILSLLSLGTFIFLSGFLLSNRYRSISNIQELKRYFFHRFIRVYPLYLMALVLFIPLYNINLFTLLSHILLINMLLGNSVKTIWFISMIAIFYLILPWIMKNDNIKKMIIRSLIIYIIFIIIIVISYNIIDRDWFHTDVRLLFYFPIFIIGVIVGKYDFIKERYEKRTVRISLFLICLILITIKILNLKTGIFSIDTIIVAGLNSLIIISAIPSINNFASGVGRYLNPKIIKNISYLSFCIFLFHRVIFGIILWIIKPTSVLMKIALLIFIATPILLSVSYLIQKTYDIVINKIAKLIGIN